jgi:transcriptional regulator with XRE-family HTH domain
VKAAAAELMDRNRELPRLQAYRYACGLSQDQAAARYNDVTGHRTTLGGTTINAWEAWARGRGTGSPPPLSALLILADAYGRGPLRVAEEVLSPSELVADVYERLAPEDRAALIALPGPVGDDGVLPGPATPDRQDRVGRPAATPPADALRLVTSAGEVHAALLEVVDGARETLVAVGSRSREPAYLRHIERAVRTRPDLVHYRILIGLPRSHLLKDHLLALLKARSRNPGAETDPAAETEERLRLCMVESPAVDLERFFTASERAAVVVLPSANAPTNFDTALVVEDPGYARRLVEHGQALFGHRILDTAAAVRDLPVLR